MLKKQLDDSNDYVKRKTILVRCKGVGKCEAERKRDFFFILMSYFMCLPTNSLHSANHKTSNGTQHK